jgi:hypothetical protein
VLPSLRLGRIVYLFPRYGMGSARDSRAVFGDPPKTRSNPAKRNFKWRQSRALVQFPAGRRKPPAGRRRSPEDSAQIFMAGLHPR